MRHIAPPGTRKVHDLLHQWVQVNAGERQLRLTLTIEFPHPRDRLRHVVNGSLNGFQIAPSLRTEIRLPFQQRVRVEGDGRDGIVDVMSDAARHLPERTQAFLLHHGLLSQAQIIIGHLQCAVELRLMRRECDMLAQLPQKLAFVAAETVRLAARRDEHPEKLVFHQQRSGDQGAQSASRQTLGKGQAHLEKVRFVAQLPLHAAGQAVLVDIDVRLLGQRQLRGEGLAAQADAGHLQPIGGRVIGAKTTKVDVQLVLQRPDHHLENAREILTLADRTGDLLQQIQVLQARLELALRILPLDDVVEQDGDLPTLRTTDPVGAHIVVTAQRFRFVLEVHRLTRQRNLAVDFEPVRLVIWSKVAHQFALGVVHARLLLERRIDFQKPIIHRFAVRVENHFNRAKPLDQGLEKGAIPRF